MSHSSKVSLSSFLVFPRQVVTWSENRHDNRNRFGVAGAAAALLYFWINPLIFGRWHFTELKNIGNRDCLCCPSRMALILRACKFCSTPLFYWLLV